MTTYKNTITNEIYLHFTDKKGKNFLQWKSGNITKPDKPYEVSENWNTFNLFIKID